VFVAPLLSWVFYPVKPRVDRVSMVRAILGAALLFFLFDLLVTGYFWTFNSRYTLGLNLLEVPVEELFFFLTVGFACLFTYAHLKTFFRKQTLTLPLNWFSLILVIASVYVVHKQWWYSLAVIAPLLLLVRTKLIKEVVFLYQMAFVLLTTLIFNWYLTARPIVLYNSAVKSGVQIGPIPLEDFFFGVCYISLVIYFYEKSLSAHR
jgi:lycopene cyclase domain-containing protein